MEEFSSVSRSMAKQATYTLDMPLYMNHARHELEYQLMGLFLFCRSVDLLTFTNFFSSASICSYLPMMNVETERCGA